MDPGNTDMIWTLVNKSVLITHIFLFRMVVNVFVVMTMVIHRMYIHNSRMKNVIHLNMEWVDLGQTQSMRT